MAIVQLISIEMEFVQVMQLKMSVGYVKVMVQQKILIVMAIVQLVSIVVEFAQVMQLKMSVEYAKVMGHHVQTMTVTVLMMRMFA